MLVDSSGRLFGKINVLDFITLAMAVLVALGIMAVQSGWYRTSGQVVKGETDIKYTIMLRNVQTLDPDLFKAGQKLSMTIRNQPRGEVLITRVERTRSQAIVPSGGSGFRTVEDPVNPNGYNYLIHLKDHATVTSEGYVTEGVKVKIGMSIEVEGMTYRLGGVIVDVQEAREKAGA